MFDTWFNGIFNSTAPMITVWQFLICLAASVVIGLILALSYMFRTRYTKSFVITLALLPAVVCVVIMMVNGNVGTGVAVAGAFSLVRFRSVPGTAREIAMLFLAMGSGLIAGMGYIGFAFLFTILLCVISIVYNCIDFGTRKNAARYKTFRITIPEDLDYTGVFEEVFAKYTRSCSLTRVKTTNMGSMFRLTYDVILIDPTKEKELIDLLRQRNGNLEITVSNQENAEAQL